MTDYTIIDVDTHVTEAPDLWTSRVPASMRDAVPYVAPDRQGRQMWYLGKQAIARFWDNVIGPNEIRFCIRHTYACGNECANVGTITVKLPGGIVSRTELVMVYRVNAEGLLESMRAFWEFDQTAKNTF